MTTALIILSVSLVIMAIMIHSKHVELETGKARINLSSAKMDITFIKARHNAGLFIKGINYRNIYNISHKFLEWMEYKFIGIAGKGWVLFAPRFKKMSDIVKGKNIPKNKGCVSFFLKNIEEHKKQL